MPTIEERLAALERQQSIQSDALRYLVEGRWTGALPHAAAEIASLYDPAPGDFAPIDFPKAPSPAVAAWQPVDMRGKLPINTESAYGTRDLAGISGVTVHYTAGPESGTAMSTAAYQTSEGARGQTGNGTPFPGLAYTLFVEGNGRVVLAHSLNVRVWHSAAVVNGKGRNYTHVGLCYAGNREPNAAQIKGLAAAIRWLEQDQLHRQLAVEGHGDQYPTACPGATRSTWLPHVVALARD